MPTHVWLTAEFLDCPSVVLLEQIRCIDKQRVTEKLGRLSERQMEAVDKAARISIGLEDDR